MLGRGDDHAGETGVSEDRLRTIEQERAYNAFMMELGRQERWLRDFKLRESLVPPDWHRIERDVPVRPRKTKVTAAFDADMVRWFRRMGHGYQARMNSVLRSYMLALISKAILSEGDTDRNGDEIWGRAAPRKKRED
jgi:BrnA antitoxin of type II toxin-antitoxin system